MIHRISLRKLTIAGDTIVEVMIVLAILGFAFTLAATTANKGLNQSQNAQEHSQAQGILNSQMELVRQAVAKDVALPTDGSAFCINPNKDTKASAPSDCAQTANGFTYTPTIKYMGVDPTGYYAFSVTWPGSGSLGNQQEVMNYRVHGLTTTTNTTNLVGSAPQISATVLEVAPGDGVGKESPNPTPSCSAAGTIQVDGVDITLNQILPTGSPVTKTTSYGAVGFVNLQAEYTYNVVRGAVPAGFTACDAPTKGPYVTHANQPDSTAAYKIIPQCTNPSTKVGETPNTHTVYNYVRDDSYTPTDPYWWHDAGYFGGGFELLNGPIDQLTGKAMNANATGYYQGLNSKGQPPSDVVVLNVWRVPTVADSGPLATQYVKSPDGENAYVAKYYWTYYTAHYEANPPDTYNWDGYSMKVDPKEPNGHQVHSDSDGFTPIYKNIWKCSTL